MPLRLSLFFYGCRGAEGFLVPFGLEFEPAVVGINTVLFLFDIGELDKGFLLFILSSIFYLLPSILILKLPGWLPRSTC